jgi:hypothetical protein
MALTLKLPTRAGALENYALRGTAPAQPDAGVKFNRIAYSAAHVVADPLAAIDPWLQCAVDWDATIAYRQRLWSLGLGVAEAMDTAQRGMGLDWPTSWAIRSLMSIRRRARRSTGTPRCAIAITCGRTDWPWPRRWTPRSAGWGSTGRPRRS